MELISDESKHCILSFFRIHPIPKDRDIRDVPKCAVFVPGTRFPQLPEEAPKGHVPAHSSGAPAKRPAGCGRKQLYQVRPQKPAETSCQMRPLTGGVTGNL